MAFDLPACPTGWTAYAAAAGRTIIGANATFTAGANYGRADILEADIPSHVHAVGTLTVPSGGAHLHSIGCRTGPSGAHGHSVYVDTLALSPDNATAFGSCGTANVPGGVGDHTHSITGSTAATGGASATGNLQPSLALRYCRKN